VVTDNWRIYSGDILSSTLGCGESNWICRALRRVDKGRTRWFHDGSILAFDGSEDGELAVEAIEALQYIDR